MNPILYNDSGQRLASLDNLINDTARIKRVINGEYVFSFQAHEKELKSEYFAAGNFLEIESQYFDIKYIQQSHDNGEVLYDVQCEHVNYRLQDGVINTLENYSMVGTPTQILDNILLGTEFISGVVNYSSPITLIVNKAITRKALIYELANSLGGEIDYSSLGFTINLRNTIGQDNGYIARFGKNLKGITKIVDNRGDLRVSYTIDILELKNSTHYIAKQLQDLEVIEVGDSIRIIDDIIGLDLVNRIVSMDYNPIFRMNTNLEIANTIDTIASTIQRIDNEKVKEEGIYNGVKIGAAEGFVADRSDGKAKVVMNATDGISVYSNVGAGLVKNFYVDTNGKIKAKQIDIDGSGTFAGALSAASGTFSGALSGASGTFTGAITAGTISIGSANDIFKVDSTGNMWLGHANYASAPFKVNYDGVMSCTGASISGNVTITGGSGISNLTDAGDLAVKDTIGTIDMNSTIISGGKIVTGILTASNIQTGTLNADLVNVIQIKAANIITVGLSAEKIYAPGYSDNFLSIGGDLNSNFGDLMLHYNGSEYFRVYNAAGGGGGYNTVFKIGGVSALDMDQSKVESRLTFRVGQEGLNDRYFQTTAVGLDGRTYVMKHISGVDTFEGFYTDPADYSLSITQGSFLRHTTKYVKASDYVSHSTNVEYLRTSAYVSTAKNTWNFDGTLQYGGVNVDDKYCKNMGGQILRMQYTGGYLEIWNGGTYIGRCLMVP